MIVVADTSPINYLILIQEVDVLPKNVRSCCNSSSCARGTCADFGARIGSVLDAGCAHLARSSESVHLVGPLLAKLDIGERDAIMLAKEPSAGQLIIDEREGRREAERRGISVIGTLGVVREAATLQLLGIRVAIERLRTTASLSLQKFSQAC